MRINYIIATYEGICKRTYDYPPPKDTLKLHLQQLVKLKHNLEQVTIMKPVCNKEKYDGYYDIGDIAKKINCKVVIEECENYGYSSGQWFLGYERYPHFDYYIFNEDDYCPNMDNFDDIIIPCYNKTFFNSIGLLCSHVETDKLYPRHWGGTIILSGLSLKKLYNNFEKNPRKYLDLLTDEDHPCLNKLREYYIGAYYQITSALLFTKSNIQIEDYLDYEHENNRLTFPYWQDARCHIVFYEKGKTTNECLETNIVDDYRNIKDEIKYSPFIPIQLV